MAELLLNWAVVILTLAALALIAFWSFRDLLGRSTVQSPTSKAVPYEAYRAGSETSGSEGSPEAPESGRRLCVEYHRNGETEHVQWVTDERPGYIGTEAVPGMGSGILVRHVRLFHEGDGFLLENRHGSKPLLWRADGGRSGELPPGERLPVDGEVDVVLGGWTVTLKEE
ncbi:MAG: hypothetical protein KY468_05725 [Armatimonadetes bacterium]|nr:hypothetical protein [Armatimonadota bacterium]